ncbi:MAG TPA: FAD-dependent oxidoreductase [Deltaproteobacteria bacterium]|nr:FAD-dependent oxidoreductase [Deltaproteobacteria bacterium]HQI01231.1 FAD-dependent oxidoreductase [Deltaproteobacteria bacterium]
MGFDRLFSPIAIQGMELKNRIVMLPMSTGFTEPDNTTGDRFINFYTERAKGGAGLIVIPFTPMSDGAPIEPGLFDDRFLPGVSRLTSEIHSYGAKAAAQLIISYIVILHGGLPEIVGPSPVFNKILRTVPRELTRDEIRLIVSAFGDAARRSREGGFDAVEVLVGGGYILNRFLSPIGNERKDEYGGSLENRMRIILEIIEDIREKAGRDFPIMCRLNVDEQMPGGHTIEESKEVARALERAGVSAITIYTGWHESPVPTVAPSLPKGAFAHLSQKLKECIDIPVIATNRINDPYIAEKILAEGKADLIGMGRALLADPELPNKAGEGRVEEILPCLACSECLALLMAAAYGGAAGIDRSFCSVNPLAGKEAEGLLDAPARKKRVYVIGSGPAGMVAARTAASRGHEVTVLERESGPGGRLVTAALPPFKDEIRNLVRSLHVQGRKAGVKFRFNTHAGPELIEREKPDAVVLATGADVLIPPVPGIGGRNVVPAEDVLTGHQSVHGSVIVVGGGMVGCETAEFLVERGVKDVTVLEMLGRMADNVVPTYRPFFLARLKDAGVKLEANTTVTGITEQGVSVVKNEVPGFVPGDTVVLAAGFRADPEKLERFKGSAAEVYSVGDCVKARTIKDAIEEGFRVGKSL